MICSAVNHIFISALHAQAWECYCCGQFWWLSEEAKQAYIIMAGCSEQQAETDLNQGLPIFVYGQYNYEV